MKIINQYKWINVNDYRAKLNLRAEYKNVHRKSKFVSNRDNFVLTRFISFLLYL